MTYDYEDFDRQKRVAQRGISIFGVIFALVFCGIIVVWGVAGYLTYKCYAGGDPNAIACFMISDRVEIGVRHR